MLSVGQRAQTHLDCACTPASAEANRQGIAAHGQRRLNEASQHYSKALAAEPAATPDPADTRTILRFAPRVFTTANEPFALRDAAAIMHPRSPWIAYHLFWDDDIDFPDDNDPCDHEVLWVRLDETRRDILAFYTYFHGRLLKASDAAVADARANGGRPKVVVQWGKHGTMPEGWKSLQLEWDQGDVERSSMPAARRITLEEYNRATWNKLHTEGRQSADSPLGRGWPKRFTGTFEDFTSFPKRIDILPLLQRDGFTAISSMNNAVLNRRMLRYNFSAKTEWPAQLCIRLIAHRGGVVSEAFSENSPASLEEAVRRGYWMIEVDVQESKDGVLVVHHDPDFKRFYNVDRRLADMTWDEISKLRANPGNTRPMTFRELCERAKGRLRLMIDTKEPSHPPAFYREMESAMRANGLLDTAYFIGTEESRQWFQGKARISATSSELKALASKGEAVSNKYFLFEWGSMTPDSVAWAQARGIPVVPSINTFHYGARDPIALGTADIGKLFQLGVTEFQIDSVYDTHVLSLTK
jgi:glycerophosphoryl diester phosphodiesterase